MFFKLTPFLYYTNLKNYFMMSKQITFFTMVVLVSFSVNGQGLNWSEISEIQQAPKSNTSPAATQRLDSIIYYGYDEESDEWSRKRFKVSLFFDHFSNDTLILQSTWDVTTDSWLHRAKEIKKYDENNRLVCREFHLIARSATRTQYRYNENGDLIEMTESYFKSGEWRYKKRNAYSYNSERLLQADTLYHRYSSLGESDWRQIGITDFYYTTEGCQLADTTYVRPWISDGIYGDWEFFSRTTHEYRVVENLAETTFFRWDKGLKMFRPYSKEQMIYHNDDLDVDTQIDFRWNTTNHAWDTTEMKHYAYNNDDFIMSYKKQTWGDNPTKVLELLDYDYSVNKDELLLPTSALDANPPIAFHHKIIRKESIRFNSGKNETQKFRETKYYYSPINKDIPVALNNDHQVAVMVYPNPATEFITIHFPISYQKAVFELFDVHGNGILFKDVNKDERVDVSQLKVGLYVYRIMVDARMFVGKLLVK